MNKGTTEIEIKVRVEDSSALLGFLKEKGEFKGEKHQVDAYYTPAHRNFLDQAPVKEWFRLRQEGSEQSINYKNWHINDDGSTYHCDEYEVNVDDLEKTKLIFDALNFKPLIVVDKTRRIFIYNDFEVELDTVKDLGDYIEVEYKGKNTTATPKEITDSMVNFIESNGAKILERDFSGYPFLLLKKYHGISNS